MIIRERPDAFVMIAQHHHAKLSRDIMSYWNGGGLDNDQFMNSVFYAIEQHDCGWIPFDKAPFWNDYKQAPYAFTDLPDQTKTVLYKNGIDHVEINDPYAAQLCSEHYIRFMENSSVPEAKAFVISEKQRQDRLRQADVAYDQDLFDTHYDLLKSADNLSLYICLNEPDVPKAEEHPFFRDGIPVTSDSDIGHLSTKWKDAQTIRMNPFPFKNTIILQLFEKVVIKQDINEHGLIKAYQQAETNKRTVKLIA